MTTNHKLLPDSPHTQLHARDGPGITGELWRMQDLFDALDQYGELKRRDTRLERLLRRVRRAD
ncbi:MAG TPA: hypothetical protein VMR25_11715 [Planctomycetaceae bacterium]|nr:hypothetical protein [Planctomycetaceae bacterium]